VGIQSATRVDPVAELEEITRVIRRFPVFGDNGLKEKDAPGSTPAPIRYRTSIL